MSMKPAILFLCALSSALPVRGAGPPAAGPPAELVVENGSAAGPNLMPNGDFNEPSADGTHPAHWQAVDNLVFHWTNDPGAPERGRVILIDTDVSQEQAYRWWTERFVRGAPLDEAPAKDQPEGNRYDTIGGLDGGHYWSDYIEVEPGGAYRVFVDARGPASKVFIRGYVRKEPLSFADEHPAVQQVFREARGEPDRDERGRPVRHRLRYRYTTWFPVGGSGEWRTYTHREPRRPNDREITQDVRYIRIMLYPYWPVGEYWYDNVRVVGVEPGPGRIPAAGEADFGEGRVIR